MRAAIDDEDLLDEAEVEHATAKELIAQIESETPANDEVRRQSLYAFGESINHHVEEEQNEMFPDNRAKLDMAALGERILARKQELKAEMGLGGEEQEASASPKKKAASNKKSTKK